MEPLLLLRLRFRPQTSRVVENEVGEPQDSFGVDLLQTGFVSLYPRQAEVLPDQVDLPLVRLLIDPFVVDIGILQLSFSVFEFCDQRFNLADKTRSLASTFVDYFEHDGLKQADELRPRLEGLQQGEKFSLQVRLRSPHGLAPPAVVIAIAGVSSCRETARQGCLAASADDETTKRKVWAIKDMSLPALGAAEGGLRAAEEFG
ncbi:MAG: hypothetical protein WCG92_20225 [Hyphomicrobiales bacterium]